MEEGWGEKKTRQWEAERVRRGRGGARRGGGRWGGEAERSERDIERMMGKQDGDAGRESQDRADRTQRDKLRSDSISGPTGTAKTLKPRLSSKVSFGCLF